MERKLYTSLEGSPSAIRLLLLHPGIGTEKLQCHLQEAVLGPDLSYIALSYVWNNHRYDNLGGDLPVFAQSDQVEIICNQQVTRIGVNLHSALQHIRHATQPVRLWVDSLCIDQQDVSERNHQVSLMRNIYESSREVIIWLGESTWDMSAEVAFGLITRLAEGQHIVSNGVFLANFFDLPNARQTTGIGELNQVMDMSWWRRMWVVQETVVAAKATVHYGNASLSWSIVAKAAANFASEMSSHPIEGFGGGFITEIRDPLARFSRTVLQIETTRAVWVAGQSADLLSLLRKFRYRESTDKRDKVFALLGIVTTWDRVAPLLPNYALSLEEVLLQTTIKVISSTQSLSILEGTIHGHAAQDEARKSFDMRRAAAARMHKPRQEAHSALSSLPSWTVDWTVPPASAENERLLHLELFDASLGRRGLVQLHGDTLMEIQGYLIDTIDSFGEVMPTSGYNRMRNTVERWLNIALSEKDHATAQKWIRNGRIKKRTRVEAFAMSICGGLIYNEHATSPQSTRKSSGAYSRIENEDLIAFRHWSNPDRFSNRRTTIVDGIAQAWTDAEANQGANSVQFAIETSSSGRTFFTSRSHRYMGIGPSGLRKGDVLCVVLGSRVPLILRPNQRSWACQNYKLRLLVRDSETCAAAKECSEYHRHTFEVVGDAYVHGVMDGEIVSTAQTRNELPSSLYLV